MTKPFIPVSFLKKLSHLFRKATITALFGAVIVAFYAPAVATAQTAGSAPRGQVLQATTNCNNDQALSITVEPSAVSVGSKVKLSVTLDPACVSGAKITNQSAYQLLVFNGEDASTARPFQSLTGTGVNPSLEFNATEAQFLPVGAHKLSVRLSYNYNLIGEGGTYADVFRGSVIVTSVAAASGEAKLSVVPGANVSVGLTTSTKTFDVTYTKGPDGKEAAQISYKCTESGPELKAAVVAGSAKINCEYPKQAATHRVSMQALDSAGALIPGAVASETVTITGSETNQTGVGDVVGNPVVAFINFVVGSVLKFFIAAMGAAVGIIGTMLESVLSIRTFSDEFANVIYPAWEIFRNLGNILFILAIVAIGVATVFRISGYAVKDLLVKLILGAILINFSLTIAQAVLGISDTLQQQFLSDRSGAVRAIVNTLFVSNIWADTPGAQLGDFSETIRIVTQFFIAFAAFFAILAIAILVCVRVVMLWLLLMLSPIPYVAMILPSTRKFSGQWWDAFVNWALVTPAVGFMLNLTALMTTKNSTVIQDLTAKGQLAANESWLNNATFALARNVIPLIFLYMTLKVATSFGKGAGGFVTKSLNKVSGMAFAPAAALGGYAAGVATSTGNFAKNVGKAPLVLAQQKLAEGKASREARLQAKDGSATASDYLFNALSMPSKMNQVLEAKVKRGEGNVKDAQKRYSELVTDLERRKYSWDGTKAIGNKVKMRYQGRFGRKGDIYERAEIKTDEELVELLKKGLVDSKMPAEESKKLLEDAKLESGHIAYGFVEEQLKQARLQLGNPATSEEDKKELQTRVDALSKVVKDGEIRRKNLSAISGRADASLENLTESEVTDFRTKAQDELTKFKALEMKSEYAPSFLADKYRRANTKGAASKLPDEYVYGEVIDFARKAFAKGDMYGALAAVEQMQKEGNTKDLLKEFGYGDTAEDLSKFFKDKFGGMGDDTVVKLLRESDKYAKSAGAWDLAGKIKYDEKARKYVEVEEGKRIAKSLKDKIGEGSVDVLWRQLTGKVAFATGADGKSKLSKTYVEALKQIPFDDPRAVQKFMNMHNGPTAKAVTVLGEQFKTTEEFNNAQEQLKEALGPEHYNQVFRLLQYQSGVMPKVLDPDTGAVDEAKTQAEEAAIMDEVKNVNAKVNDLKKAAKADKPDKGQGGAGQNPQGNSKQNRKKNNGGNSSNPQSGPQSGNPQGGGQSSTYRGGGGGIPFVK